MCVSFFYRSFYYYFLFINVPVLVTKDCTKSSENNSSKNKIVDNKIGYYNGIFKKLQTNYQA